MQALPAGDPTPGADGYVHPTGGKGRMTSPFGERVHPVLKTKHLHDGQDIAVPVGTPILAAKAGKISAYKPDHPRAGQYIYVDHGGGSMTGYMHLSKALVKLGDTVKAGQPIGLSGGAKGAPGSGTSTGPHLHFRAWTGGKPVDPMTVVSALKLTAK